MSGATNVNDLRNDPGASDAEEGGVPTGSNNVHKQVDGRLWTTWDTRFPKWREAIFLTSVGGMSFLLGFGSAVSSAKKKDTDAFDKGVTPSLKSESGVALASRALRWGTFYAVTGCGVLFFCIWKMLGVQNLQEFRQKAGEILPRIPKNDPPQGRTEFKNLTDLLQYIIDEDNIAKANTLNNSSNISNKTSTNGNSIDSNNVINDTKSSKT